ncbi:MAG: B12-binding domain-containing radical SAM protein [Candidatus Aminicenantes bacterium]|nr:MAG: B12-binding domain-containing radical SAM protein [Candidatus Aminicenantes bacterium]
MNFNTLLIYLPAADFTQPYPAIPYLAGYLRHQGENVIIKDLNIEAHEYILSEEFLEKCRQKLDQRFAFLDKKNSLNFNEQKEYMKCLEASGVNPKTLKPGKSLYGFRDKEKFFNFKEYQKNSGFLRQALTVISSAYFPTQINAAEYTTPFFLSSRADIIAQTSKDINPFIEFYQQKVIPLVAAEKPDLIGISVTYPSQVLQMFAAANLIKKKFPAIHICAGGAFICRMVLNMPRKKFKTLFDYLDSIIVYEGETALYKLILHLKALKASPTEPGRPFSIPNVIYYDRTKHDIIFPPRDALVEDLDELPPPDFNGFPLDKYFSPKVVLPYAPTRGCYWNKCAFCHYGATKEGTARYRETSIKKVVDDMEFLANRFKVNHFAFSIDIMSPAMALNIADEMIKRKLFYPWNTEIKIEKNFTRENCKKLKQGGCLSVAIGLESGSQRILELIEKGYTPQTAGEVIKNLSDAGICVQVMSFLDFPTETPGEAMETIRFISANKEHISLFTLGDFELLPGSRVFRNPQAYGITNVGYGKGDEFKILCLYKEKKESKLETDAYFIDSAYLKTAEEYAGLEFPFAGAVSTNHTFLYFEHFGKDIFKNPGLQGDRGKEEPARTLDRLSRPALNPGIKIIEGNFSLREISESLEKNTSLLKDSMNKSGQSYRQAFHKILNKNKVFSSDSFYILWDDMKWSELPGQVKEILDLCNGENLFEDIIESKGTRNKGFIEKILNQLFSLNILID